MVNIHKVILYLMLSSIVYANDISYRFHLSNKNPYRHEAIILDANITQIDHSKVMLFKFTPKESSDYAFHQIQFQEEDKYHALQHHYAYLIYPKKEGTVTIALELTKSLTDDDKVAYAISGDRDNIKGLVKKDIAVEVAPLTLEVKAPPTGTDLVGDFTLSYHLDTTVTQAYEPIYLKIELKGKGVIPPIEMIPPNRDYHLFTQKPKQKTFYSIEGITSSVKWDYALSAKENFVLPKVVLNAFNPLTKKRYELTLPSQTIEVKPVATASLVDSQENPPSAQNIDWSWLGWLFSYLTVFLAGVLMPKDIFKREVLTTKSRAELLADKIQSTKSHKELLLILLSCHDTQYKEMIRELESVVYNNKKIALNKIKRRLNER